VTGEYHRRVRNALVFATRCVCAATVLGAVPAGAHAAGTLGQQRTLDVVIVGKGAVLVEQCERMRPFSLNQASCAQVAECVANCSVPVVDPHPVNTVAANGVTTPRWVTTWVVVRSRPDAGYATQSLGSDAIGQRHRKCGSQRDIAASDCRLYPLENVSMEKAFVVRFAPTDSLITRTTDLFRPLSRTSSTNAVRVQFELSTLLAPIVRSIELSCAPESGGSARAVIKRKLPSRALNASYAVGGIGVGGLDAGTTYRCTMTAATRGAGAHDLSFIVGTTGGASGGGAGGGGGGSSSGSAQPIGPIVL